MGPACCRYCRDRAHPEPASRRTPLRTGPGSAAAGRGLPSALRSHWLQRAGRGSDWRAAARARGAGRGGRGAGAAPVPPRWRPRRCGLGGCGLGAMGSGQPAGRAMARRSARPRYRHRAALPAGNPPPVGNRGRDSAEAAASLPHIARGRGEEGGGRRSPCLLVALRPRNVEEERERFFRASFAYDPQFEYAEPVPAAVLDKYGAASDRFVAQAIRIIRTVLEKYGTYESFEVATGGRLLSKCQIWSVIRKYMQKEGCVGEVVVQLTDDLLSQAVMMVEDSRPTLAINLAGARQHWLEGMLRHEIGTHYIRGVNNTRQPWHSSEGRKQYSLKPANPTEEGLASLHSVLFRKQPFLWRAALLYYTIERASRLSFSALFQDLEQYVQDAGVRWEYCVRAKRGQTDTSQPGCFSKDQVYLDGILRILRHRQTIDFPLLAALGKVSYEDVNRLKKFGVLDKARIPHFMQDLERYMKQLDHIVTTNGLNEEELEQLLPD
uniref:KIAA0895 like n=1 Tax=Malurus cyaneus samueli TaxID=2593467 RepID=A0A8C5TMY3_9PASS